MRNALIIIYTVTSTAVADTARGRLLLACHPVKAPNPPARAGPFRLPRYTPNLYWGPLDFTVYRKESETTVKDEVLQIGVSAIGIARLDSLSKT